MLRTIFRSEETWLLTEIGGASIHQQTQEKDTSIFMAYSTSKKSAPSIFAQHLIRFP
jgi:hypothetical protein